MNVFKRLKQWIFSKNEKTGFSERRIVCAANRLANGIVICGVRHHDNNMRMVGLSLKSTNASYGPVVSGFVDQHGIWMNRQEAWAVAKEARQIVKRVRGDKVKGGTLYSENLY